MSNKKIAIIAGSDVMSTRISEVVDMKHSEKASYLDGNKMVESINTITNEYKRYLDFMPLQPKIGRIVGYYNPETDKQQSRNELCKCGSGMKFKKCCINKNKGK